MPERYPLRFNLAYQLTQGILTDAESTLLQEDLMPTAIRRVARLLDLKRSVQGALSLSRLCKTLARWRWGQVGQTVAGTPQAITCIEYFEPKCGNAVIPDMLFRPARLCTSNGPDDCSDLPQGPGVLNADTIVFVTVGTAAECAAFSGVEQTAFGKHCYRDQFDRPIALNVHLCPNKLQIPTADALTSKRRADLVAALVRALLQGLGFDHELLPYFRDPVSNEPLVVRDAVTNEPTGPLTSVLITRKAGDGATDVPVRVTTLRRSPPHLSLSTLPNEPIYNLSVYSHPTVDRDSPRAIRGQGVPQLPVP